MTDRLIKQQVLARDGKCRKCGALDNLTIDHIIPVSRGGLNSPDNLQAMCKSCNSEKSSFISWDILSRIQVALHVDEIITRFKNETKSTLSGIYGTLRKEIESVSQSKIDKLRNEWKNDLTLEYLQKQINGQAETISFLTKQIRAMEAYQKVKWVEETTTFEGYKKVK